MDKRLPASLTPFKYGPQLIQTVEKACIYKLKQREEIKRMANKMDLVERIATTIGCTKADGERAIEAVIEMITESLKSGHEVSIAGLGIFEAKTRAGRMGRNPRTGASIQIKSMRVPKFRASKTLKDAIK